jgi:hypothetical protein
MKKIIWGTSLVFIYAGYFEIQDGVIKISTNARINNLNM